MQILIDFLPVLAFFVAYYVGGFNVAIVVIMVAMALQVTLTWLIRRTVNRLLLGSAALVIGIGAVSLALQNELLFKWKPTVFNWVLALAFLASQFIGEKPLVRRLLGAAASDAIRLPDAQWRQLNLMWVAFFLLSGAANIFVAYRFSEEVWVNFKLFGLLGMTLVFVFLQALWMARHQASEGQED